MEGQCILFLKVAFLVVSFFTIVRSQRTPQDDLFAELLQSSLRNSLFEIEYDHDYILVRFNVDALNSTHVTVEYRDVVERKSITSEVELNGKPFPILNLQDGTLYIVCVHLLDSEPTYSLDKNCQIVKTNPRVENSVLLYKKALPILITVFCVSLMIFFLLGFLVRQHIETKKRKKRRSSPSLPPPIPHPRPSWTLVERLTRVHTRTEGSYLSLSDIVPLRRHIFNKNSHAQMRDLAGAEKLIVQRRKHRSHSLPAVHDTQSQSKFADYLSIKAENDYASIASGSFASVQILAAKLQSVRRLESLYENILLEEISHEEEKNLGARSRNTRNPERQPILLEATTLHL